MSVVPVPYYCEENAWQLCVDPRVRRDPCAVIVLSNATRTMAMLHQRAAAAPEQPVVWDYHVIVAARSEQGWMVWDPDTTLGMPVPLSVYLRASLGYPTGFPEPYDARFRVMTARYYRQVLATDRRHMLDEHGEYRAPPPPWPPIGEGSNLMALVDMDASFEGEVVSLGELPAALDRVVDAAATSTE